MNLKKENDTKENFKPTSRKQTYSVIANSEKNTVDKTQHINIKLNRRKTRGLSDDFCSPG